MTIAGAIAVRNEIEEITTIYGMLEAATEKAALPDAVGKALLLVSEELFSNVVRYGYAERTEDRIEVTIHCHPDCAILTLRDHAAAYDVSRRPAMPAKSGSLDDLEPGGLGLFLVHHFAKTVRYWREGEANVTEVTIAVP